MNYQEMDRLEAFLKTSNLTYSDLSEPDLMYLIKAYDLSRADLVWLEETIKRIEKKTDFSDTSDGYRFFDPAELESEVAEKKKRDGF